MDIVKAEFVMSNSNVEKCPVPDRHEYAFIGRSNVGKSSLINMLANNKKLAKTASRPGKTQLINHFVINNSWYNGPGGHYTFFVLRAFSAPAGESKMEKE